MNDKILNVNLTVFKDRSRFGNFGDEISKVIVGNLINTSKYNLLYNQKDTDINIVGIGSYIHAAKNNSYIFGSGIRMANQGPRVPSLNICAVRGPDTKKFLESKNFQVPEIYGDPALLLPEFYTPNIDISLKHKIGVVPHKSNQHKYRNILQNNSNYCLISPTRKWHEVIDMIASCKFVLSSSLHGLICADAYNIPNVWLDEFKLAEGDFKFKDYFSSQHREYIKITNIDQFNESAAYSSGNRVDLSRLKAAFPLT